MDFKKRKIVFLLTYSPDPRITKRINALAEVFNNIEIIYWKRFDDFFHYSGHFKSYSINIPYTSNIYLRIFYSIALFIKSIYYLFKCRPNLIYIDGIDMIFPAFVFKILSFRKVKIVLEIADLPANVYKKKHRLLVSIIVSLINFLISKLNSLVLTSPYFWEDYYSKIFPYPDKIIIIKNIPEKSLFENFKTEPHENFVIGFIGFIRYVKQLEMLFEACKDLKDVKIIIAGGGPEAERLREVIKNYKNVYYLGPYDYKKDILKLYSQVDLLYAVYDTSIENVKKALPNKLYEAIVCEIPIVVARGTNLADYVKKLGVGFSVSDSDPEELRDLVIQLINNPDIIRDIKEKERKIKEKFYWENVKEDFKKKILDLIYEY